MSILCHMSDQLNNNGVNNCDSQFNLDVKRKKINPVVHNPFNTSYIIPNHFVAPYPHLSPQENKSKVLNDNWCDKQIGATNPNISYSTDISKARYPPINYHSPGRYPSIDGINVNYNQNIDPNYKQPSLPNFQPIANHWGFNYYQHDQIPLLYYHNSAPDVMESSTSNSTFKEKSFSKCSQSLNDSNQSSTSSIGSKSQSTSSTPIVGSSFIHLTIDTIEKVENSNSIRTRKNLSEEHYSILINWLKDNLEHPYPSYAEKEKLKQQTGLTSNQLSNFFINARRRKLPKLRRQAKRLKAQQQKQNPDPQYK